MHKKVTHSQSTRGLVFLMIIRISPCSIIQRYNPFLHVEGVPRWGRFKKPRSQFFSNTNEMTADWTFLHFYSTRKRHLHISGVFVHLRRMLNPPAVGRPGEPVLGTELPGPEVREADRDAAANGLRPVHGRLRAEVEHFFAVDLSKCYHDWEPERADSSCYGPTEPTACPRLFRWQLFYQCVVGKWANLFYNILVSWT